MSVPSRVVDSGNTGPGNAWPGNAGPGDGEPSATTRARQAMVADLAARGIRDKRVLAAMERVPRHHFVPDDLRDRAHADGPQPIGDGQTISQPYMVACMTEALGLTGTERVLEIGTGSGYQTAILAELVRAVVSVERISTLAESAAVRLADLGLDLGHGDRVAIHVADGTEGWPDDAPYDRILVTAGAPEVPPPLLAQLADGGCLVIPVGPANVQMLTRITRQGEDTTSETLLNCVFVPLIGHHGWTT